MAIKQPFGSPCTCLDLSQLRKIKLCHVSRCTSWGFTTDTTCTTKKVKARVFHFSYADQTSLFSIYKLSKKDVTSRELYKHQQLPCHNLSQLTQLTRLGLIAPRPPFLVDIQPTMVDTPGNQRRSAMTTNDFTLIRLGRTLRRDTQKVQSQGK